MSEGDVLIRGATLYDGTGAPPRRADVALSGDRIASVGDGAGLHANVSLDAAGLALAPGFIDVHTHDDFALVVRPEMDFKILGGVTTVVVGNCGMGAAPWPLARGMAAAFHPGVRLPEWSGYRGYFAQLEREPASVNAAALVGHGTARGAVMGNAKRAPSATELEAMRAIVREGRDAGAVGFSTGLIYEPGCHADAAEVTAARGRVRGQRRRLRDPHARRGARSACLGARVDRGRPAHGAPGRDLAPQGLGPAGVGAGEGVAGPDRARAGRGPRRARRPVPLHRREYGARRDHPERHLRRPPRRSRPRPAREGHGRRRARSPRVGGAEHRRARASARPGPAGRGRARRRERARRHRGDPLDERGRRAHRDAPPQHHDRLRRHPEPAGQAAPAPVGNLRARARPLRARARAVPARGGRAPHDGHGGAEVPPRRPRRDPRGRLRGSRRLRPGAHHRRRDLRGPEPSARGDPPRVRERRARCATAPTRGAPGRVLRRT